MWWNTPFGQIVGVGVVGGLMMGALMAGWFVAEKLASYLPGKKSTWTRLIAVITMPATYALLIVILIGLAEIT